MKYLNRLVPVAHECPWPDLGEVTTCRVCGVWRHHPPGGISEHPLPDDPLEGHRVAYSSAGDGFCGRCAVRWPCPAERERMGQVAQYRAGGPVPRLHMCPMPEPDGPAVLCGDCGTWRACQPSGAVISTPSEGTLHRPVQSGLGDVICIQCGHGWPCETAAEMMDRQSQLHVLEVTAAAEDAADGPEPGSPDWWAGATGEDLEPGWWGQPDTPEPVMTGVCTGCGLAWPPREEATGLCRYCRLAKQEREATAREMARELDLLGPGFRRPARPAHPVALIAGLVLTFLQMLGALVVAVWGFDFVFWLLGQVFG